MYDPGKYSGNDCTGSVGDHVDVVSIDTDDSINSDATEHAQHIEASRMTPSIQVIVSHREAGKHVYDYTKEHEKL
jgi:hypothetical protein